MSGTQETTLALLGDDIIDACLAGRDSARDGLQEYKQKSIARFRTLRRGTVYGMLHDFYFSGVSAALGENSRVEILSNKAGDHILVDEKIAIMFKKHGSDHRVSSYPTKAAKRYHSGQMTLSGLQLLTLTAGYVFDEDLNDVGAAVISHRVGLSKRPEWCVEIERAAGTSAPYVLTPVVDPDIPLIEVEPKQGEAEGIWKL